MTSIITHRGLDHGRSGYFSESSREAFTDQLERGYSLEFDVQPTKDSRWVVFHDSSLIRITGGKDNRNFSQIETKEILSLRVNGCGFIMLDGLCELVARRQKIGRSAVHVKSHCQTPEQLSSIFSVIANFGFSHFLCFDLTVQSAEYVKERYPGAVLAPSVSDAYDVERYSTAVGGTLMTVEEALAHRDLFDWVWLDEWDRVGRNGGEKVLLNKEIFKVLRGAHFSIAVVSPELHGSSPGKLAGEAHEDALLPERLHRRMLEILELQPDAICTDFPDVVKDLYKERHEKNS